MGIEVMDMAYYENELMVQFETIKEIPFEIEF